LWASRADANDQPLLRQTKLVNAARDQVRGLPIEWDHAHAKQDL
jgi:hypothetical protein